MAIPQTRDRRYSIKLTHYLIFRILAFRAWRMLSAVLVPGSVLELPKVIIHPRNLGSAFSGKRGKMMALWLCLLLFHSATGRARSPQSIQAPTLEDALQAAAVADKAGDYARAAKHYQDFLDKVDASKVKREAIVQVRTRLATLYFLLHEYRESLRTVAPVTENKDSSAPVPEQAWLVQGLDDLEINQLSPAIPSLRQAIKLNPASGTARLALGDALARSGNLAGAIDQFKEQLRRTPDEVEAWYKLGLAYAFLSKETSNKFWQR